MKAMVGMSGGVDSAVAAYLVNKEYETQGVTLRLWCGDLQKQQREEADARAVCEKIGIEHSVLDLQDTFAEKVIDGFIENYKIGLTPNPCIECNRHIKFGEMLEFAESKGCEKIATGHYARVEKCGERYLLKKAADAGKDQSYVLYSLSQKALSSLLLPLGDYTKSEIREIACQMGFDVARKSDSQDICFVPDGDYAEFIRKRTGEDFPVGDYVDINGNILGQHKGVIHYTVGQRKGLGIALGKPQFVISKCAETGRVVLGDEQHLFYRRVEIDNVNLIAADKVDGLRAEGKLRYRHSQQPCTLHQLDNNRLLLEFDKPQRAPAPGQAAVIYDGDIVIGGGTIVGGIE